MSWSRGWLKAARARNWFRVLICRLRLRWRRKGVLKRFQKHFSLLVFLLTGGCAVGPHYKSPQPAAVVKYHSADTNLVSDAPFDSRWWKQFEDPVLDSLVGRTLISNNSIRIARARLAESRAVFDERSEEHTSELQSQSNLVCRLLLEKKRHKQI